MIRSIYGCLGLGATLATALLASPAGHCATFTTIHAFQGAADGAQPAGNISMGPDGWIYGKAIENSSNVVIFRIDPGTGTNTPLYAGSPGASDDAGSGVAFGTNGLVFGASYYNAGSGECFAGCGLVFQVNGTTHTLSTLYQFQNSGDGRGTQGVITGPGGALYGTADEAGTARGGAIFRLNPATGKMVSIHSFNASTEGNNGGGGVGIQFGPDGALYGVNGGAGQYGYGTIYRIDPLTRILKVLHQFTPAEGNTYIFNTPSDLVISDSGGTIYGTTLTGGVYGKGMIYRLVLETNQLTVMYSFNGADANSPTRLVAAPGSSGDLFGLTVYGGPGNFGTVFKFNTLNRKLTTLYSFTNTGDGAYPGSGGLILGADGTLYGTTLSTLFKVTP